MNTALVFLLACGGWRQHVKDGDRWLQAGNPGAAARAYDKALDRRPEDPEILLKMAEAELGAGQAAKALPFAERAFQAEPPPKGARAVYIEALIGTFHFEPALDLLGDSPEDDLRPLEAEAWIAAGDLERAAAALALAEPTKSNRAALAYVEVRLGRPELLEAVGEEALDWTDVPSTAWADVGAAWFVAGEPEKALAIGDLAVSNDARIRLETGLRATWMEQARLAEQQLRLESSLRLSLRAASVGIDDAELCWMVGSRWFGLKELEQGAWWLERALMTPPYDAPDPRAAVASASTGGLPAEDRNAIRLRIARPLADAYLTLEQPTDEVRAMVAVVQAQEPAPPEDLMRLSRAHERASEHLEAAEAAQQAAGSGHPEAAEQAARSYAAAGQVHSAIGWANAALEAEPANADLALLLAELYISDRRYQAALEVLDHAIRANPNDHRLTHARSHVFTVAP